jgi:hypothetical protein
MERVPAVPLIPRLRSITLTLCNPEDGEKQISRSFSDS